jgi:hypothetical protein
MLAGVKKMDVKDICDIVWFNSNRVFKTKDIVDESKLE